MNDDTRFLTVGTCQLCCHLVTSNIRNVEVEESEENGYMSLVVLEIEGESTYFKINNEANVPVIGNKLVKQLKVDMKSTIKMVFATGKQLEDVQVVAGVVYK